MPPVCIAIDFETAGYYGHSACAIGLARMENFRIVDQFHSLIKPPSSRICFTHVHGLTWKDLKNAEGFAAVWGKAREFLAGADFFIAHNAAFDRNVLAACCKAFNQDMADMPFLCTLKGSRKALKLPSCSLNNVCGYFQIALDHHHADSDARGCALIYANLRKMGLADEDMLLNDNAKKRY